MKAPILKDHFDDIHEKEAAALFTSEGQLLQWLPEDPKKEKTLKEILVPAALSLIRTTSGTGLPPLTKIFIEGSQKIILMGKIAKGETWVALQGSTAVNIGLAMIKFKQLASSLEAGSPIRDKT